MRQLLIRTGVNAIGLWLAALLVPGITLAQAGTSTSSKVATVILVALVFGLVNAVVKPIAKGCSFPLIVVTLGLFTFVVNGLMLALTSWLSGKLGLAFHVDEFWWDAVLGALVITLVSMAANLVLPERDEVR
ncbi:phage holin family protein [Calidifontibacter sp. DB0510]|uniref:Phage holin family protein n=1 Tax=Metallococcus carri TaxID=1656884 RepID=A0A967B2A6_9MICO|nr:phage holin family protein [Metallococcus carri]NHN56692.1 phage holin family protein [Metallococcus carri]NOP37931.1 phage holin family protein [Calidifontibacter sp. DB2511S]